MSICGTFLVVITASFLKPLLSSNQSLQLPMLSAPGLYNKIQPFEGTNPDSDEIKNLFLTVRLPEPNLNSQDSDLDTKRQFDPWGGKRLSKPLTKEDEASRKRQFSPWGGKRSQDKNSQLAIENDSTDTDSQVTKQFSSEIKRGFNSWGGKRNFNSWGGKRNFNSWGGKRELYDKDDTKRNFNSWGGKRGFNSWGGKRGFNSWGGKRNFNAWGGKRFAPDQDESLEDEYIPKKNTGADRKRQAFNSWGGKRGFNSWGGKRNFNSWGGKRALNFEPGIKELNSAENNVLQSISDIVMEGTEKNKL